MLKLFENFTNPSNNSVSATVNGSKITPTKISGNRYYVSFNYSAGTNTFQVKSKSLTCDILVIGGGGAGANFSGGGGGAGAMIYKQYQKLNKGTYKISVGKGGDNSGNASGGGTIGKNGDDSSIYFNNQYIFYAVGGGAGSNPWDAPKSGGSGGGAGSNGNAAAESYKNIPSGTYGNAGAPVYNWSYGGGGGGAGSAGKSSANGIVGNQTGGDGLSNNITGSSVTYAKGGNGGYYNDGNYNPEDPIDGRGNGGDGANYSKGKDSGKRGAHGIVIIAFNLPKDDDYGDDDYGDDDYGHDDYGDDDGGGSKSKSASATGSNNVAKLCASSKNNIIVGHSSKATIYTYQNNTWVYSKSITPN